MSIILGRPIALSGKKKPVIPKFTYTGDYVEREDGVVELLTSGIITFPETKAIDVFMVGGGGAGGSSARQTVAGWGGGGGGYTRTIRRINVIANNGYQVTVGAGAIASKSVDKPTSGSTAFGSYIVEGGISAQLNRSDTSYGVGANGGSGGGGGRYSKSDGGAGGSDGSSGEVGSGTGLPASGQGFTTREFGEAAGKLYAGGGGGGTYISAQSPVYAPGGSGGGGAGAWGAGANQTQAAGAGGANTGGGGGGGVSVGGVADLIGGSGGSGIVCFRVSQELPELLGTWVLHDRLYAPVSDFAENVNFTFYTETGSEIAGNRIRVSSNQLYLRQSNGNEYQVYNFGTNSWQQKYRKWKFETDATASDEFRAWLAANATKQ